jgi:hypothetical protein
VCQNLRHLRHFGNIAPKCGPDTLAIVVVVVVVVAALVISLALSTLIRVVIVVAAMTLINYGSVILCRDLFLLFSRWIEYLLSCHVVLD